MHIRLTSINERLVKGKTKLNVVYLSYLSVFVFSFLFYPIDQILLSQYLRVFTSFLYPIIDISMLN